MQNILTCKFEGCNSYYLHPVLLPCSKNVCKHHVDAVINNEQKIFKCQFCLDDHKIPENGFTVSQDIIDILDLKLHLGPKEKEIDQLISNIDSESKEFQLINQDPYNFIYEYVSNIRNKIDFERERLMLDLHTISDIMLTKLNSFETECKRNLTNENIVKLNEENESFLKKINAQIFEWKDMMRKGNKDQSDVNQFFNDVRLMYEACKSRELNYKNKLLCNKICKFSPCSFQINQDFFGRFNIEDQYENEKTQFNQVLEASSVSLKENLNFHDHHHSSFLDQDSSWGNRTRLETVSRLHDSNWGSPPSLEPDRNQNASRFNDSDWGSTPSFESERNQTIAGFNDSNWEK
jgi:hypothetical protein